MGKVAYTIQGAAKAASISDKAILKAISARKLHAVNVEGRAIIPSLELARWINEEPNWFRDSTS